MAEDTSFRCPVCGAAAFEVLTTTGLAERIMCCGCDSMFKIKQLMLGHAQRSRPTSNGAGRGRPSAS